MRRFTLTLIVALLTLSASGMASLIMEEPCTGYELAGSDDGACPPTCVTCGCCAQAVEPAMLGVTSAPDIPAPHNIARLRQFPQTDPLDILHVPKRTSLSPFPLQHWLVGPPYGWS